MARSFHGSLHLHRAIDADAYSSETIDCASCCIGVARSLLRKQRLETQPVMTEAIFRTVYNVEGTTVTFRMSRRPMATVTAAMRMIDSCCRCNGKLLGSIVRRSRRMQKQGLWCRREVFLGKGTMKTEGISRRKSFLRFMYIYRRLNSNCALLTCQMSSSAPEDFCRDLQPLNSSVPGRLEALKAILILKD